MKLIEYGQWTQIWAFDLSKHDIHGHIVLWSKGFVDDNEVRKLYPDFHYRNFSLNYFYNGNIFALC